MSSTGGENQSTTGSEDRVSNGQTGKKRVGGAFSERFSLGRFLYASPFFARRMRKQRFRSTGTSTDFVDLEKGSEVSGQAETWNADTSRKSHESTSTKTSDDSKNRECAICLGNFPREYFPNLRCCQHLSCYECLQQYLRMEISEARVSITCPECHEFMDPNDIKNVINDDFLFEKYQEFALRRFLMFDSDTRWCPAPDCGYAVIATGCASCPKLKCERPGCSSHFCYHCKALWHPNQTCDAARAIREPTQRSHKSTKEEDIKSCPLCNVLIVKMDDGSCNHMTCAVCGAEFCWLCMNVVGDLHYLSPSGCTFWGKKPWSRKKKILWQLGILVGAPVGIALIAGIAIPAIMIGVPIWTGRKMFNRYRYHRACIRNSITIGSVLSASLVSPILAILGVTIGVPVLLFYVYGVVPVSLCRSSGCAASDGIAVDFDETAAYTGINSIAKTDMNADVVSHIEGNPSIGEVSLSLGSGILDNNARDQDRESSSTVALAGSISARKREVLKDTMQNGGVLGCETTSQTSDCPTSSTRGLSGSLLNYKADASSTNSYKIGGNDQGCCSTSIDQQSETNLSLSSLEELTASLVQRVRSFKQSESTDAVIIKVDEFESDECAVKNDAPPKSSGRRLWRNLFTNSNSATPSPPSHSSIPTCSPSIGKPTNGKSCALASSASNGENSATENSKL